MSIFGSIMNKIFHAAGSGTQDAAQSAAPTSAAAPAGSENVVASPTTSPPAQSVDIGAVLAQKAKEKGGGGNCQSSIVDLLKLLNLDSSLDSRKQLAAELNVHAGADGSAEENIALHKAVMQKLAENGGKVPDSMKG